MWVFKYNPEQTTQVEDFSGASYSTLTAPAFGANVKEGSTIVAVSVYATDEVPDMSDTLGSSYTNIDQVFDLTDFWSLATFYAFGVAGGADQVSITYPSASAAYLGLYVVEYSGLTRSDPLEAHNMKLLTAITNGAPVDTDAITPNKSPAMVWAVAMEMTSAGVPDTGAGFTSRATFFASPTDLARSEDKQILANANVKGSFVAAVPSGNYIVSAVVFKLDVWVHSHL